MAGIISSLNLGIGVVAGLQLSRLLGYGPINLFTQASLPLPYWAVPLVVVMCIFPFMVLLDAKPTHGSVKHNDAWRHFTFDCVLTNGGFDSICV